MGVEIEKALGLKYDRRLSDIKCFIEFQNKKIILHYGKEETYSFNNLHDMYEWLASKHKRFYVYTNNLNLILEYYLIIKNIK